MMDLSRLYKILDETTVQLRKGDVIEGSPELVEAFKAGETDTRKLPGGVLEIYAMPHESEAAADIDKVDLVFLTIGVSRAKAQEHRAELITLLDSYPQPARLAAGPSYIEVGGEIGDQGAAFQLFALGKTLGLWEIITPASFGMTGEEARQSAGLGYIMITGYRAAEPATQSQDKP